MQQVMWGQSQKTAKSWLKRKMQQVLWGPTPDNRRVLVKNENAAGAVEPYSLITVESWLKMKMQHVLWGPTARLHSKAKQLRAV